MAINTSTGPERVVVTPTPIGNVFVNGASTAVTAVLVATTKATAPLNTPVSITSFSSFESTFGTEAEVGEAYLTVKGFYDNAGEGSLLIVVAVEPTGVSGEILEASENEAPRSNVGTFGQLSDNGIIVSAATIDSYTASSGQLVLDMTGASGLFASIKVGDFIVDASGRFFPVLSIKGSNTLVIESSLDRELVKSAKSLAADASEVQVVRLFNADQYAGKLMVQEGDVYGSQVTVAVSGVELTLSAFDAYLNDIRLGDILVDSSDEEYIVVAVLDGNNIQVDRVGLTAGAVDFKRGLKNKVIAQTKAAGAQYLDLGVAPYSAEAGKVRFNLADSESNPPKGILADYFVEFSDGSGALIEDNDIIATSTSLVSAMANPIAYNAQTGVVTMTNVTVITDGVKAGDVLIDATGKEFIIHEVITELTVRIDKNIANPSSLAGAKINKGAVELEVANSADFSAKVVGEADEDTTGEIAQPANLYLFDNTANMKSDDYFVVTPDFQAVDYAGSSANLSGLYALDSIDNVNIICIPGIYDPVVQNALISYCDVQREDCIGLLSIPEFIDNAASDEIVVSNLSIDTIQSSENGSIISFVGSPDFSAVSSYDLLKIGSQSFTIKAVSDEDKQVVLYATAGIPSVGAISIQSPSAVSWKDVIINYPTKNVAWYYNHLLVADSEGAAVVVDPVLHVAGIMNRIDQDLAIGGVSHAPAGIQNAQIAGTIGLQLTISERTEAGPLRLAYINRITSSVGNGRYVFGGYTAAGDTATADDKLIQIIRSIKFIKVSLEAGLVGFLWENNAPVNRQNIENSIFAFLRTNSYLFPAGLPEEQQFKVIPVDPTQEDIDAGIVRVRVQVRINSAIRFIDIPLEYNLPVADQ